MTPSLQPMTAGELVAYKTFLIEDYARDLARNFHIPEADALQLSARDIESSLKQGLASVDMHLYHIAISRQGQARRIGYLWIEVSPERRRCYIHDIYLFAEFRGMGYGRQVLEQLEQDLRAQGVVDSIGLHVFADNPIARELYKKLGFFETGINMQKRLDGE